MQNKKSLALFFSLIPGAGHMYIGLQKKGVELMILFFSLIFLGNWLDNDIFSMLLPVIWFYSIFDVRNCLNQETRIFEKEQVALHFPDYTTKYVAYIFVLMGVYSIFKKVVINNLELYISWEIASYIRVFLASGVLIFIGIKLLSHNRAIINNVNRKNAPWYDDRQE